MCDVLRTVCVLRIVRLVLGVACCTVLGVLCDVCMLCDMLCMICIV